jgi:hypothetical protein
MFARVANACCCSVGNSKTTCSDAIPRLVELGHYQGKGNMIRPRFFAKPWKPAEEEHLRAMILSGMSVQEVSSELERTVAAVRARSEQLGISLKQVTVKRTAAWSRIGLTAKEK